MKSALTGLTLAAALLAASQAPVSAQEEVTLRIHQFLPAQAVIPANFIAPWAEKVTEESDGRITFEHYPAMQLGGAPPALFDQVRDGVADIIWTLPGYTPGRFPGTEAFELPFMPASGEATSQAAWEFYEKHLQEEFEDVHIITVHVHGPGLIHAEGEGVRQLEDMNGLKVRGPTRIINNLLESLGATPVGMPVPAVPEALSTGVIDGTVIPWEVTLPLRVAELVETHTSFSGDRGLYTSFFIFAMNKDRYESLPDDLKQVIDDNSGLMAAQWAGRAMDEGDIPAREFAEEQGNEIIILDEEETQRWKDASQSVVDDWIAEMDGQGYDGRQLYQDAKDLIDKYASQN